MKKLKDSIIGTAVFSALGATTTVAPRAETTAVPIIEAFNFFIKYLSKNKC
jgi:hypothetical protein